MLIKDLKTAIENKTLDNELLVFVCKHDNFIANQYIKEIANAKNQVVNRTTLEAMNSSFFTDDTVLNIVYLDNLTELTTRPKSTIIITEKASKKLVDRCIVEIPKLEAWMLDNYIRSNLQSVDDKLLTKFSNAITDPYQMLNEVQKISIFPAGSQQSNFEQFLNDNIFCNYADKNIFDFSSAIFQADTKTLSTVYSNLIACDIEPLGLATILYNNIKNMMLVALQKYPNEENTGLKANQIYAIRKQAARFSREQLLKMYNFVSGIDFKLKSGELDEKYIVDYLTLNLLNVVVNK